jgi:hypothetical protein
MQLASSRQPFTCVTCLVEIAGPPTFHVGLPFCCAGCAADGPCICSYDGQAADVSRLENGLPADRPDAVLIPLPEAAVGAGRR